MKTWNKLFLTLLICGFVAPALVHAKEHAEYKHGAKGQGMAKIFDQLNLSEDQRKLLEANKKGQREEAKAGFTQMKALQQELNKELMNPELDMNKIDRIKAQLKAIQAQMVDRRIHSILEVRKILTPEQFVKFLSMKQERGQRWKNKGGN